MKYHVRDRAAGFGRPPARPPRAPNACRPPARAEPLRSAEPPPPAAPHRRRAGLAPSPRADTIPRPPHASPPAPFPSQGLGASMCVPNPPVFSAPRAPSVRPREAPAQNPPPRSSLVSCPLRRRRSNGSATAVPHHTPLRAARPTPRARGQKERAASSAPRSFRRLPAPPAPQPLDCGRRKPLHERAPERVRAPGRPGPPPPRSRARARSCGSCCGGRRLARAPDARQRRGRGRGRLLARA